MNKALVVGIDKYPGDSLTGCVNDANSITELLRRHENGDVNFHIECRENVRKRAELRQMIRQLFKEGSGETALFYFAGHGCIVGHEGYLMTPDCGYGDEGIQLSEILELANETGTNYRNRVVILDCCCSGAVCKSRPDGLGAPNIATGVTLMAACDAKESAAETSGGGAFTKMIVFGLNGSAADICGAVTPSGLYACVDRYFGAWQQRPVFATNVKTRVILRKTHPLIPMNVLRNIIKYFDGDDFCPLDPSYECTNDPASSHEYVKPYAQKANVSALKDLQKMERVGLVVPCGEEHMYYAAMHSRGCRLTEAGKHIRDLVANNKL